MKAIKRVLSFGIVVLLICGTLSAYASEERKSGLFTYALKGNGTAVITKFDWDANDGKDVFIPRFVDGYTVTEIGDKSFAQYDIDNFLYRMNIGKEDASVTLPDTVVSIGKFAFAYSNIAKINIPSSVEYIGAGAFLECNDTLLTLQPKHPYFAMIDQALYYKPKKELIAYFGMFVDPDFAIPRGIVSIGDYAFYGKALNHFGMEYRQERLIHPDITHIGDYAFSFALGDLGGDENDFESIIPDTVSHIGKGVFVTNDGLLDVIISEIVIQESSGIREIPESAFRNVNEDSFIESRSVSIYNPNITSVGSYAFENIGSLSFTETSAITFVDEYAFSRVADFSEFEFPDNLAKISNGMFFDSSIGAWFAENGNRLPDAVRIIESEAFLNVSSDIRDLYLPSGITSIALDAFEKDATFVVEESSYAERWARENGFGYKYPSGAEDDLDWLKND